MAEPGSLALSIVIASYNRAGQLRLCLEALARQTLLPQKFEVVVVVDGSTDATLDMLAQFHVQRGFAPLALRWIEQANAGQCAALNRGVQAASGSTCLLLDDDIIASPGLAAAHLELHRQHPGSVGIGQLKLSLPPGAGWYARGFARAWDSHYARLNRGERPPSWEDAYSGNLSFSRQVFLDLGGFALDLQRGYDVELAYRFQQAGQRLHYLPEALGEQDERKDGPALMADAEQAGAASVQMALRHASGPFPAALGAFREAPVQVVLFRRLLLAAGVQPALLFRLSRFLPRRYREERWFPVLQGYAYWRGVRRAATDAVAPGAGASDAVASDAVATNAVATNASATNAAASNAGVWRRLTGGVPVLMYHAFGHPGEAPSRYILPVERFERQMAWLSRRGYRVISLEELLRLQHGINEDRLPPERAVVITMDDGYADNYALAYPILQRYGFPATIFLVSSSLGGESRWDSETALCGRPLLSRKQVLEMASGGISFGSHSHTHPVLKGLDPVQAKAEICGSKTSLERELGLPVRTFAYPFGLYDAQAQALVEKAGYLGACTVRRGLNTPATPLTELRRMEVWGEYSLLRFALALWLGEAHLPESNKGRA